MYVRTSSAASWSMWATWGNRRCRVAQTWSSCRPAAARSGWAKMVRTRAAIGPWACLGSFCRSAPGYAAAKISEIARSGPLVGIRDHQPHPSQPPPHQLPQELRPELVGLAGPYVEPQDFPGPVLTYPNGYHRRSTVPPGRRSAPAPPSRPATHTDTPPPRADSETAPSPRPAPCRSGRPRSGCSPPAPGLGPGRLPSGCSPPLRDASCTTLTSARSARRRGSSRLGKNEPCLNFGMLRVSVPTRVSHSRCL